MSAKWKAQFFIWALILFLLPDVYAESVKVPDITSLIDQAVKSNPKVIASHSAYKAANNRIIKAASLDDAMLEFEYNKINADRALTLEPMKMYSISQTIPFPTKLYLRAKIASKLAKAAYEEYVNAKNEIISSLRKSYTEYLLTEKIIEEMKSNRAVLSELLTSLTTKYAQNESPQDDVLKVQIEIAETDNKLLSLGQKLSVVKTRINLTLNNDDPEEAVMPAEDKNINMDKNIEEFYALMKKNNPELKAYEIAIARGKDAYDLSLNEFMPDFTLRFQQMVMRDRLNDKAWAGMLGVTVPLWFFQKQSFGVFEMKEELNMLKAEYNSKLNTTMLMVKDAYTKINSEIMIRNIYQTAILPQAEAVVKNSNKKYSLGTGNISELIESQKALIEKKIAYYNNLLELMNACYDLETAVGVKIF